MEGRMEQRARKLSEASNRPLNEERSNNSTGSTIDHRNRGQPETPGRKKTGIESKGQKVFKRKVASHAGPSPNSLSNEERSSNSIGSTVGNEKGPSPKTIDKKKKGTKSKVHEGQKENVVAQERSVLNSPLKEERSSNSSGRTVDHKNGGPAQTLSTKTKGFGSKDQRCKTGEAVARAQASQSSSSKEEQLKTPAGSTVDYQNCGSPKTSSKTKKEIESKGQQGQNEKAVAQARPGQVRVDKASGFRENPMSLSPLQTCIKRSRPLLEDRLVQIAEELTGWEAPILDVGGDPARHNQVGRSNVWTSCPISGAEDAERNRSYKKRGLSNYCKHTPDKCKCRNFEAAISVHSVYYLTPQQIYDIIPKTRRGLMLVASYNFMKPHGAIGNGQCVYKMVNTNQIVLRAGRKSQIIRPPCFWLHRGIFGVPDRSGAVRSIRLYQIEDVELFVLRHFKANVIPPPVPLSRMLASGYFHHEVKDYFIDILLPELKKTQPRCDDLEFIRDAQISAYGGWIYLETQGKKKQFVAVPRILVMESVSVLKKTRILHKDLSTAFRQITKIAKSSFKSPPLPERSIRVAAQIGAILVYCTHQMEFEKGEDVLNRTCLRASAVADVNTGQFKSYCGTGRWMPQSTVCSKQGLY